jgi:serine/threonine protein phosphatase PrpC
MAFEIDIGFTSLAGKKEINEDFAAAMLPEPGREAMGAIAAIADGVSLGGMGREAAQTTVTSVVRDYFGTPETWDTTVALDRIITAQNSWLAGVNRRRQPACGLTSLAHVGDTRAYLLRGGEATQLTQDHAVDHPDFSHGLLRAVGAEDRLVVDYSQGDVHVGDTFVLLSDGVHNSVPAKQLPTLAADSAQALSEQLVQSALQLGSRDNATALVLRVLGVVEATLQDENRLALQLPIPPRLKMGDAIDGLTVTALVADNGINILYQVRDTATRRLYALKTLHPQRAHDAQERGMLAHEAWLAKRMRSGRAAENLVAAAEPLVDAPTGFYILYEWHGGETLQQMLDRKHRFNAGQAVAMATQVARALGRLHRQSVIHRDVKPANLHQGEDGVLRLLALERGASRPLTAPPPTPLMHRDPTMVWKLALAISVLFNALLVFWLLFLPK